MPRPAPTPAIPLPRVAPWRHALLNAAAVAVLALVLIQCLVSIAPDIYWDADPRSDLGASAITTFGPAGAAWIGAVSVAAAALALAAHLAAGGRLGWVALVLTAAGAAACVYHAPSHVENLTRGGSWIGAAVLGLAAWHLARHDGPRRLFAASFAAMLIPLAIGAAWYVWVDHPETIRMFNANHARIIESQGWVVGSPQDLIYQRRVMIPEVTGAFGMSNVFGSIAAAATLLAAAGGVTLFRAGRCRRAILPAALAAMGLLAVVLSRSRGAAVAAVLGAMLLALAEAGRTRPALRRLVGPAAIACIIAAILVVLLRGWHGPGGPGLSVYFRYQYWTAAVNIIAHGWPLRALLGIGPAAMQPLYLFFKDPLNPEEITSAHNVFIDFITMLGVGGLAWTILLLAWIRRVAPEPAPPGRGQGEGPDDVKVATHAEDHPGREHPRPGPVPGEEGGRARLVSVAALAVIAFGVEYAVRLPELDALGALVWLAGAWGFLVAALVLLRPGGFTALSAGTGLFLAAAVLLIHNQIELTFFHQGAAAAAFVIVGAAGGSGAPSRAGPSRAGWLIPPLLLVAAAIMVVLHVVPVARQQEALRLAAEELRAGRLDRCIGLLDKAISDLPSDPRPCRWRAQLYCEWAGQAADGGDREKSAPLLRAASEPPAGVAIAVVEDLSMLRVRAQVLSRAAELLHDPSRLVPAADAWREVVAKTPYGLQDRIHLADALWRVGRHREARAEYRRALELNEQRYLDPLQQLSGRDKAIVGARLSEAVKPSASPPPATGSAP